MSKRYSSRRWGLRATVGLGAAVASLAFAGLASAAVQVIQPDAGEGVSCPPSANSSTLTTAIENATAASNTIVLTPGEYCPVDPSGQSTITISHNLTIVADHSFQATGGLPQIQVAGLDDYQTSQNEFTVNPGVTLTLEGFNMDIYISEGYTIANYGTVNTWGMTFGGDTSVLDNESSTSVATFYDSTLDSELGNITVNSGTLTFMDSDLTEAGGQALQFQTSSAKAYAYNTLIADNNPPNCLNGSFSNPAATDGSLDDDHTCGVEYENNQDIDNHVGPAATLAGTGGQDTNGGPTTTVALEPNSDTTLKGNPAYCLTTDQRFFVNPIIGGVRECDIGATTGYLDPDTGNPGPNSATQETAAPTCTATVTTPGVSQQVALQDTLSGIGPEVGVETDNYANTMSSTYPPVTTDSDDTDGVPQVPGTVPGDSVSNLFTLNAAVSFTAPTSPTTSPVPLTATAVTAGTPGSSMWSFTGDNWAGVSKACY